MTTAISHSHRLPLGRLPNHQPLSQKLKRCWAMLNLGDGHHRIPKPPKYRVLGDKHG
jgi:hypothetical protein